MCFGAFTALERCERCGRVHPEGLEARCIELAAAHDADGLDAELAAYLDSPEARFFSWLGARAGARADR